MSYFGFVLGMFLGLCFVTFGAGFIMRISSNRDLATAYKRADSLDREADAHRHDMYNLQQEFTRYKQRNPEKKSSSTEHIHKYVLNVTLSNQKQIGITTTIDDPKYYSTGWVYRDIFKWFTSRPQSAMFTLFYNNGFHILRRSEIVSISGYEDVKTDV